VKLLSNFSPKKFYHTSDQITIQNRKTGSKVNGWQKRRGLNSGITYGNGSVDAMPVRSLPKQEYLQATVIPLVLEGLAWIIKERLEDPVEGLAMFLIKNNPMTPELHKTLDLSEFE
jgi:hypothetical protein